MRSRQVSGARLLRGALAALAFVALAFACAGSGAARAEAEVSGSRPNIVVILCDDMGWSDLGCMGSEIETPHIDRLASEGLLFTQFYNCAKCTTTRAALVTGLYPRPRRLLARDRITIAEAARNAGYRTSLSGKWHLGAGADTHPVERGFERYFGLLDGCCNFFAPLRRDPAFKGGRVRTVGRDREIVRELPDDFYMTDAITDHAVESIEEFAKGEAPFFAHICYTAPHYPLHARPADIERFRGRYLEGWDVLRERRYRSQLEMGLIDAEWKRTGRDPLVGSWEDEAHREWQDLRMAVYAAMIHAMDRGVGRVLAALEKAGVAEDTLVMFLSDNGGCSEQYAGDRPGIDPGPVDTYTTCGPSWAWAQNTPFRRYKTWMHEGGIATPLLARWPKAIAPGTRTSQVGHVIDILPTLLDLAGVAAPKAYGDREVLPIEGRSLAPILAGGEREGHEALYWQYGGNHAIREGDWKLVWDRSRREWELYDLSRDRTEMNDLVAAQSDLARRLEERYLDWARSIDGDLPKPRPARTAKKPAAVGAR